MITTVKKLSRLGKASTLGGLLLASQLTMADMHILIPGGPGGGWDTTARGVGEALTRSKIEPKTSFQNLSGGGGGRAIAYLIEAGARKGDILMVNSTPIVLRALMGQIPNSYRDLQPVAGVVADYAAFVVRPDSPIKTWQDAVDMFRENPRSLTVAGGSARGSMDHLVPVQALTESGVDGIRMAYIPYDAGGKAKAGLLSGEVEMLSTGFSEALDLQKGGQGRIIAMTAPEPIAEFPEIPTLKSQGVNMEFSNWRGFFASKDVSPEKIDEFVDKFGRMMKTDEWETVRARNGWMNQFVAKEDFVAVLEEQEAELKPLMQKLGFIR